MEIASKRKKVYIKEKVEKVFYYFYEYVGEPKTKDYIILAIELLLLIIALGLSLYNMFSSANYGLLFFGIILYCARNAVSLYKKISFSKNAKEKILFGAFLILILIMTLLVSIQFFVIKNDDLMQVKVPATILYFCIFFGDIFKILKEFYRITD